MCGQVPPQPAERARLQFFGFSCWGQSSRDSVYIIAFYITAVSSIAMCGLSW